MDSKTNYRLRLAELRDMLKNVQEELRLFNELVKGAPESQFLGRLKIKTVFGCIEAYISLLKAGALLHSKDPEKDFTREEHLALQGLKDSKGKCGTFKRTKDKRSMKESLELALCFYTKVLGIQYKLDLGSRGGRALLDAIHVRDRIIHPKSASDWTIRKKDLDLVDSAWDWFGSEIVKATTLGS